MQNVLRRLDLQHENNADKGGASNFEKQIGKGLSPNLIPRSVTVPDTATYHCLQVDNLYRYSFTEAQREDIQEYIQLNHTLTNVQLPPYM
jgi:hypothetical protein